MEQVKYLTKKDLVRFGVANDAANWGKFEPGEDVVHPVYSQMPLRDEVSCLVVANMQGDLVRVWMSQRDFDDLQVVPTHESVKSELRRIPKL